MVAPTPLFQPGKGAGRFRRRWIERQRMKQREHDVYWSGRTWRRLKRLWPLGAGFAVLAGGIALAALLT